MMAFRRFGVCVGPNVALRHSRIQSSAIANSVWIQCHWQRIDDFSTAMTPFCSRKACMHCALPQFAAFKTQAGGSSTSSAVYSCRPCSPFQISLTASVVSLEDLSNARNVDRCFLVSSDSSVTSSLSLLLSLIARLLSSMSREDSGRMYRNQEQLEKPHPLPSRLLRMHQRDQRSMPVAASDKSINRNRDPLCNGNRVWETVRRLSPPVSRNH
jgi:hypothetical protein